MRGRTGMGLGVRRNTRTRSILSNRIRDTTFFVRTIFFSPPPLKRSLKKYLKVKVKNLGD